MHKDFALSIRMLIKRPAFSAAVIATLALGITANTTVFTFVNAFLLKPFPFPNDHELVALGRHNLNQEEELGSLSYPDFIDIQSENQSLAEVAAYSWSNFNLATHQRPIWAGGAKVSHGYFKTLGVKPLIGRPFNDDDDAPGAPPVVILSESVWNDQFGRSSDILDRDVRVDGIARKVVGIIPQGQELPIEANVWIPLAMKLDEQDRNRTWLNGIGRLASGVPLPAAKAELESLGQASTIQEQTTKPTSGYRVISLREDQLGTNARTMFSLLLGAVALLLMIVCTNVANLQLTRAVSRQAEFAIRTAIGASRACLIRQLLIESFVISVIASVAGLILSRVVTEYGMGTLPPSAVRWFSFDIDHRILLYTAGIAILTTIVFGLVPAFRISRTAHPTSIGSLGARNQAGASPQKLQSVLIISELALALGLLAGGSVMVRGLVRLANESPGFTAKNVVVGSLSLSEEKYPEPSDRSRLGRDLQEHLESLPGIERVGWVSSLPLSGSSLYRTYSIEGQSDDSFSSNPDAIYKVASHDYFRTMGIKTLAGRTFSPLDRHGSPQVAILNAPLAKILWPDSTAVGKRLKFDLPSGDSPWVNIIGVVDGTKHEKINRPAPPQIYVAFAQAPSKRLTIAAKTSLPTGNILRSIEETLHQIAPNQALFNLTDLETHLGEAFWSIRLTTKLLWTFGAIALGLAAIGIYGVMMFSIQERQQEIGIRMALGALPREILTLILRRGFRLAITGIAVGTLMAVAMTQAIGSAVLRTTEFDAASLLYAALILLATSVAACLIPSLRAARKNPSSILKIT